MPQLTIVEASTPAHFAAMSEIHALGWWAAYQEAVPLDWMEEHITPTRWVDTFAQEGIIDMSGEAAKYTPFSETYNVCVVIEPKEGLETHSYEEAGRLAGLKVAAFIGEAARNLTPDEVVTYETKPLAQQIAQYPNLPKIGYIHMFIHLYNRNNHRFYRDFSYL